MKKFLSPPFFFMQFSSPSYLHMNMPLSIDNRHLVVICGQPEEEGGGGGGGEEVDEDIDARK